MSPSWSTSSQSKAGCKAGLGLYQGSASEFPVELQQHF